MKVCIIDCGSGNLHSVRKSFQHVANNTGHQIEEITEAAALKEASHIVLPGVGAFGDCMAGLQKLHGMRAALEEAVLQRGIPFFGICVGMQMMLERSYEHGEHEGLGWLPGEVVPLEKTLAANPELKVPHMGWNELQICAKDHPVLKGTAEREHVYFVHSYHAICADEQHLLATAGYGTRIAAAIGRDNLFGTQFHPEKSQRTGLNLIKQFLAQA